MCRTAAAQQSSRPRLSDPASQETVVEQKQHVKEATHLRGFFPAAPEDTGGSTTF